MSKDNSDIYASDYTGDDSVTTFITFAIEQYKNHTGLSGTDAMKILAEAGVLDHLADFYDVMHQHGASWLMQEMDDMVARHNNNK